MKRKVEYIDEKNGIFACLESKNLRFYYLTRSNIKKYMDYLDVGVFISFLPTNKHKSIANKKCYRVDVIEQIENPAPRRNKILYSLNDIRKQIYDVVTSFDYYLFVDFEMSMPPYYKVDNFVAEIVQVGYLLTDKNFNIIKSNSYYIKPTYYKNVSKRTLNFLKLDSNHFLKANPYETFYNDFTNLIKTYNPKMIVWGKNDVITLKSSYKVNKLPSLTTRDSFINLLQVLKTYYNLYDDLGLAKSYEKWVNQKYRQTHDALDDAYVMLEIFKVFKTKMEEDIKKGL